MSERNDVVADLEIDGTTTVLVQQVLSSVAEELDRVAAEVEDVEMAARIRRAGALAAWARTELASPADDDDQWQTVADLVDAGADLTHVGRAIRQAQRAHQSPARTVDHPEATTAEIPTVDQVSEYLRNDRHISNATVHSVRALTGGFSKRTLLVDMTAGDVREEVVIRQIQAGRKSSQLAPEFSVLQAVHAAGLPTPEPLWLQATDNVLGGPFFVMRRAHGQLVGDVWGGHFASRELCLDVARLYARLHRLDANEWETPFAPRYTEPELREMIDWQERTLEKRGISAAPVLRALLSWLRANIPTPAEHPSLLHGDAAFSNLLIEDDRVTSVLDWEAAHIGNAAEELAFLRPSVEPILPWGDFVAAYAEAGGTVPDDQVMRFFTVWAHTWRYIGCLWLRQAHARTGLYPHAVAAYVNGPRFLRDALDAAFPAG
jgi:aminoglycoside phosphotransferase (APT) family kinase protein/predicted Rdx family selenoprotein